MPTSTVWRRGVRDPSQRATSPERPSHADVEPLSPPLTFASTSATWRPYSARTPTDISPLSGLGLSHAGDFPQNDHIFGELGIDSDGVARVHNRAVDGRDLDRYHQTQSQVWSPRQNVRNSRTSRDRNHTRSGSTIDDLATAAIANSPTLMNGSPRPFASNGSPMLARPSTSHISPSEFRDFYEPPTKKFKTERLQSTEWSHPQRPATSYTSPQDHPVREDEAVSLLLGLKTEVNFSKQITPRLGTVELHRPVSEQETSHNVPETSELTAVPQVRPFVQDEMDIDRRQVDVAEDVETGIASNEIQHDSQPSPTEQQQDHTQLDTSRPQPEPAAPPPLNVKKARRLKPELLQNSLCAECGRVEQKIADDDESTISWIQCNACNKWFHSICAGMKSKAEARAVDKYICKGCEPNHGQTTYVRTSSRARTAIDYAGLNQGVIKSSVETSLHHYIQPLRTNKFSIQPDDFARIRPELLTAEFMQSFDGMKRPFVVPAAWNPRFGTARQTEVPENDPNEMMRVDSDGNDVGPELSPSANTENEVAIDCEQDLLDMVMPRDLTVRKVSELVGPENSLGVIDVKSQETKGSWTVGKWTDYYEEPGEKPVRNVISLEVSETPLGKLLRRPKVVRDLDLEDHVWPIEQYPDKKKKSVQFYCLMSVADSYTDFHIDFGGSSVYYHILKGTKVFFFIPPEDRYLKKYEEWCNSSNQNDTWLPDLCGGNVTRVDLHEGDTAFIPAGWIHSVWTPEDSLVIGGNFLTHIDYELQLKVAAVEKATSVAISFRYPFFQKVMWYTLIKYLQDDPVPEDVLEDFQEDLDYTFLRANPVWVEIGDLAQDAEPGTAEFNFRHYSKSEIRGLPALRDYLYRTARISADLPVDNITKKAVDAVKRSVPREHGDPLVLIKTFAIWCAWKMGGEPAPGWVHSDDADLSEADKKPKKVKPTRATIPGERASTRRAVRAQSQEQQQQPAAESWQTREPSFPSVVTPYKPGESAAGLSSDASKKHKPVSTKPTTVRQACDACRKRRVRCRHKEDQVEVEIKSSHSRSVSPVGDFIVPNIATFSSPEVAPQQPNGNAHTTSNTTSNLAQAALASLDAYDEGSHFLVNGLTPPSSKKSRSKACDECRKSKRRCVHDEYGNVDPAKAAEPTKPRGSTSSKRPARPSDGDMQFKRSRLDSPSAHAQPTNIEAMIDPALLEGSAGIAPLTNGVVASDATGNDDAGNVNGDVTMIDVQADRPSTSGSITVKQDPEQGSPVMTHQPSIELGTSFAVPEHAIDDSEMITIQTPHASTSPVSQRHSSRQPKQVDRFVPDDHRSPSKALPNSARRASSTISGHTLLQSVKSRRSSSNTSNTVHVISNTLAPGKTQSGGDAVRPGSRGRESTAESELDADEKMARELQAEEHGLRRRQSMRL